MSSLPYLVNLTNIFSATEPICLYIHTNRKPGGGECAHNMEIATGFCLRLFTFVEFLLMLPLLFGLYLGTIKEWMDLALARRSVFPAANRKKVGDKTKALLR